MPSLLRVRSVCAVACAVAFALAPRAAGALELKAIAHRPDGPVAYFLGSGGRIVSAPIGQRLPGGHWVLSIGEDSVWMRPERWDERPEPDYRLALGPATTALTGAGDDSGRISVDFRHDDPHHVLRLFAEVGGEPAIIVHEDVRSPVTLGVRDAPAATVQARFLDGSGVCHRRRGRFLVFARCEDLPPEGPRLEGPRPHPISLEFVRADAGDVVRLFEDISGLRIACPKELAGRKLTLSVRDVPWDECLDAMLAVHGLAWRVDGDRILIARRRP